MSHHVIIDLHLFYSHPLFTQHGTYFRSFLLQYRSALVHASSLQYWPEDIHFELTVEEGKYPRGTPDISAWRSLNP